jgi:hypothetical protein
VHAVHALAGDGEPAAFERRPPELELDNRWNRLQPPAEA